MKTLYFDCASGICGNMTLGALLDITGDRTYFLEEIAKLHLDGYKIEISQKDSYGITGTYVDVTVDGVDEYGHVHHLDAKHHDADHHHDHQDHHGRHNHTHHPHRNLHDINHIIDQSDLSDRTKQLAKDIFLKVAAAEAKVHGQPLEKVHFHEVGAIDSIIDIVGTAILIDQINPDQIISSPVNEGRGFITCAHGKMAVPVPATSEIFATNRVKFKQIDVDTELVTPTGAAIIATLATDYTTLPEMELRKVGFGAGSKDIGYANFLKVYLGETSTPQAPHTNSNSDIYVIETNIDDSTGEELGFCMEKLLEAGARDAFYTPIFMKKNRPAYKLEVICIKADLDSLLEIIFRETTTIGARYYHVDRAELTRELVTISTKYGDISGKKITTPGGQTYIYPEYESLKKLATEQNLPLKELYKLPE